MAGVEASCDPLLPAPPPPPPPAASIKRRWSPSTWRYAIEDSQPEIPFRPRPTAPVGIATAPPSSRPLPYSPPQHPFKSKPPHYNPSYGRAAEEPRRSAYASRTQTMVEGQVRSSPSEAVAAGTKTSTSEVKRKSNHHVQNSGARACENEDDEAKEDDAEQEDHEDDQGPAVYDDEYFKRRRREMSPSELYFCEICAEKAQGSKGSLFVNREA